MKHGDVVVKVERGVLWVGAEAYPLRNIARARTIRIVPNRAWAVRKFAVTVLLCGLLGGAARVVLRLADKQSSESSQDLLHNAGTAATVLALILVAFGMVRLLIRVSRSTFYALVIETAGTPRGVLVSRDQADVTHLVGVIMDAIHNPATVYQNTFHNYDLRSAQGVQIGDGNKQDNAFKAA